VEDLFAARSQMAVSLAFHIVFACAGMAMPWLMVAAEGAWLRRGDPADRELARRWGKATAILFAVGAVSGTVLSFELGLLWPGFMEQAAPLVGLPFTLEGFAFFLEAIFLGLYLYGAERLAPRVHWLTGVGVGVCGVLSALFVVEANAWMNRPVSVAVVDGRIASVDPWAVVLSPTALAQGVHMVLAAFVAVGFAVAGVSAWGLLRDPAHPLHRRAVRLALIVGTAAAALQPPSGHVIGQVVAEHQPVKLAAAEADWETERGAPFRIGGWPDEASETTRWAIEIPKLGSFLAFGDPDAEVLGLKDVPREDRPPVAVTHVAFQVMIGCGLALLGLGAVGLAYAWRGREWPRAYLRALVAAAPLGVVAVEAGWTVSEVGRQPWVVYGLLRTADAVTPMPHLVLPFLAFTALYGLLAAVSATLLLRQVAHA
jgi:cytochrome d ubiquinol oxidase subunit I